MKHSPKPSSSFRSYNHTETTKSSASNIGSSVVETVSNVFNSIWSSSGSGEFGLDKPFESESANETASVKQGVANLEGYASLETREQSETHQEIRKLVEQIKLEIKVIEKQNKMLITEAARITVESMPKDPGIYHVRFFEWLLNLLRDVRKKVSESGNWLAIAKGKQNRMGYWAAAKKHGTKYTMSGDRTPATSIG